MRTYLLAPRMHWHRAMSTRDIRKELVARVREVMVRYHSSVSRADMEQQERKTEDLEHATGHWDARVLALLGHSDLREVRMLTDAIDRIDNGTYGVCEVCGGPIEPSRLRALPTTPTCFDCAFEADQREYAQEHV